MQTAAASVTSADAMIGWINLVGTGLEIFGVTIIVVGILWASFAFLNNHIGEQHYSPFKIQIGRSLLLGLELLVAADIVKTIAIEPTFTSLGVLTGLILVRTFLGWTLALEIDGCWPWQEKRRSEPENRFPTASRAQGS